MQAMDKEHLAIASVPCQKWGTTYDPETALIKGTVFPDLNKPFFKADSMDEKPEWAKCEPGKGGEQEEREALLKQIYEVSFIVNDLTLYLDTHEEDSEALAMFTESNEQRAQLMGEFAKKFYPLAQACMAKNCGGEMKFGWTDGPMPWEGACV